MRVRLGAGAVLAAVLLLAGCGGGERDGEGGGEGGEQGAPAAEGMTWAPESVYHSREGRFDVVWPEGCSRIRIRTQPSRREDPSAPLTHVYVWCDREEREEEGAAVAVYFDLEDDFGSPPTPRTVIDLVKELMERMGVEIARQRAIRRGVLEGVQVFCRRPGGDGTAWIEGFLLGDDVYVLSAWRGAGDLFQDPEIAHVFASFRVETEPTESTEPEG